MPRTRSVLNGFTAQEVHSITGLSLAMTDYLLRHGFLRPAYSQPGNPRGRVRFYSYRDLLVARMVQRFRNSGVQISRLKATIERLSEDNFWGSGQDPVDGLNWLVSDGHSIQLRNRDGFLDEIVGTGQRSFAFVVNVENLREEVRALVPEEKRSDFSMQVMTLKYVDQKRTKKGRG